MSHTNLGSRRIELANESNVPVNSAISSSRCGRRWIWTADNLRPTPGYCAADVYCVIADSRDELIALVKAYVTPLYRDALKRLERTGECGLWQRPGEKVERDSKRGK